MMELLKTANNGITQNGMRFRQKLSPTDKNCQKKTSCQMAEKMAGC